MYSSKLKLSSANSSLFQLLNYSSQLNCIHIIYKTIDEKCIELIPGANHLPDQKKVIFRIDHADDPIKEMAMVSRYLLLETTIEWFKIDLSDNKCHLNIFEIPSIMRSIASHLEFSQMYVHLKGLPIDEQTISANPSEKCPVESVSMWIMSNQSRISLIISLCSRILLQLLLFKEWWVNPLKHCTEDLWNSKQIEL